MITAYVLIQSEVGRAGQVASAAAEIDGVQTAQPLAGPYDVIVRAEARSIDALGRLVVSRIQAINGVTRTLTCSVGDPRAEKQRCTTEQVRRQGRQTAVDPARRPGSQPAQAVGSTRSWSTSSRILASG
jgi:DNA-binding Lrp family transcriptional regulator